MLKHTRHSVGAIVLDHTCMQFMLLAAGLTTHAGKQLGLAWSSNSYVGAEVAEVCQLVFDASF